MKFDVIVGNPPYQSPTILDKKRFGGLWYKFLLLAVDRASDYIAMVIPTSWAGYGFITKPERYKFDLFRRNNPLWVNFDMDKHFSVGIKICAVVIQKDKKVKTKVISNGKEFSLDFSDLLVFPFFDISEQSIRILNKIHKKNDGKTLEFIRSTKHFTKFPMIGIMNGRFITHKMIVVVEEPSLDKYKATGPIEANQVAGLRSLLSSSLFKYFFFIAGMGYGYGPIAPLKNMPHVDLSRTWTDEELYEYFGLTQEEIDYIERALK